MNRVCVICGREFTTATKSRATTCSRECWRELMRRNAVLPVRPAQKHVRICENCGREFVVTGYSVRKTCSNACKQAQIARKVKKTLLDRYGNLMNKVCPICGREFTCKRFKERKYCSKSCKNRARGRNSETCVVCGRVFFLSSLARGEGVLETPSFEKRQQAGFERDARGIPDEPADLLNARKRPRARVATARSGWKGVPLQKPELFHS